MSTNHNTGNARRSRSLDLFRGVRGGQLRIHRPRISFLEPADVAEPWRMGQQKGALVVQEGTDGAVPPVFSPHQQYQQQRQQHVSAGWGHIFDPSVANGTPKTTSFSHSGWTLGKE